MINVVFLLLFVFSVNIFAHPPASKVEFKNKILELDKIELDKAFNELKSGYQDQYFPLMESIYLKPDHFVMPKNIEYAKIHAADILVQGYRNNDYNDDSLLENIYSYAKKSALSSERILAQNAISIIGHYDREDGFHLLLDLIKRGGRMTASASALAAASMCQSFNVTGFNNAADQISSRKLRNQVRQQGNDFHQKISVTSWCDLRQIPSAKESN